MTGDIRNVARLFLPPMASLLRIASRWPGHSLRDGVGKRAELVARAGSINLELKEATFSGYVMKIREATKPTSLALVNGIGTLRCMKAMMRKDAVDLVSMSRPFIKETDLVRRLRAGQQAVAYAPQRTFSGKRC